MPEVTPKKGPVVKFPYTPAGKEQAATFAKKVGGKMKDRPKKGRRK